MGNRTFWFVVSNHCLNIICLIFLKTGCKDTRDFILRTFIYRTLYYKYGGGGEYRGGELRMPLTRMGPDEQHNM